MIGASRCPSPASSRIGAMRGAPNARPGRTCARHGDGWSHVRHIEEGRRIAMSQALQPCRCRARTDVRAPIAARRRCRPRRLSALGGRLRPVFGGVSAIGRRRAVRRGQRAARHAGAGGGRRHRAGAAALPAEQADHRDRSLGRDAGARADARASQRTARERRRRCSRWTPRRWRSRTPRSTSRWRCSSPPSCRTRAGCWPRCAGWCGRAGSCCSSTISPPSAGRAGGSSGRWRRPRARSAGIPDFALAALLGPEDRARAEISPVPPFGLFTLAQLPN